MRDQQAISAEVERARQVAKVLRWLGWLVTALGAVGVAVYTVFWAAGDLSDEQGVSLVLGTALATILSGATAYGAGVNIGLGAERLQLAARAAGSSPLPPRQPPPVTPLGPPGRQR
jgi:predicted anti-sigma-YlaC factor YlaD